MKKTAIFICTTFVVASVLFTCRIGIDLFTDEALEYGSHAVWALLTGTIMTATDKYMRKGIRSVLVKMYGEEKVRQNELKTQQGKNKTPH